jgi:hypothetical protein
MIGAAAGGRSMSEEAELALCAAYQPVDKMPPPHGKHNM